MLVTIMRWVRAEKRALDPHRQMLLAHHVRRACALWNYTRNPY